MKIVRNFSKLSDRISEEGIMTERFVLNLSLAMLFIISATYFYFFGNGIFFFQGNKSLFIFSGEYIQKYAARPGGLLVYAGNFLTQGYFSSLYGSLLVSTLLLLLCIVFIQINKRLYADKSFSLLFTLLPSCVLLLMQTRYDIFIHNTLGYLLVALWFLVSIFSVEKLPRFIILALFPAFFYLVGSYALIYLGMYIMFNVIYEKGKLRYILPAFMTVIAILTFVVFKEILFMQPVNRLFGYPSVFTEFSKTPAFFSVFCIYIISFPLLIKTSGFFNLNKKLVRVIPLVTILTVFPIIVFLLSRVYDPGYENLMQLEKLVFKQDWDAVIKQHDKYSSTNVIGQYYYNLALSEKGQLCDRMFFGGQDFGPVSLTLPRDNEQSYRAVYFYYTIGLIGEAHHLSYELMVQHGYTSENIKMLIKTELINGNYKIAKRYINVLKKTLHYKNWAEKYERMLFNPAVIISDPELGEKISLLPKEDFFITTDDAKNVDLFLKENPDNKRAFEYKIARLLLEKDILAVIDEIKKMSANGYTYFPRHIDEAIVEFITITKSVPDLGGLFVSPETEKRFTQYKKVYSFYNGNKSLIEKGMKKPEKNTFWYYLQFSVMKSDFFKSNPENNSIY